MIPDIPPFNNYSGNNSAVQFDYDLTIENENQLIVMHSDKYGRQTQLVLNVDYSIHGIGNENGGYIIFPLEGSLYSTLDEDEVISLFLSLPIEQATPFGTSDKLDMNILEKTFDYIVKLIKILNRGVERSVKIQEGSDISPDELVSSLQQAQISAANSAVKAENAANTAIQCANTAEEKADEIEELAINTAFDIQNKTYQAQEKIEEKKLGAIGEINTKTLNAASQINNELNSALNTIEQDSISAQSIISQTLESAKDAITTDKAQAIEDIENLAENINVNVSEAAASADLAKKYAQNDFNAPVENNTYSARHWAQVAQNTASAVGNPLDCSLSNINEDGIEFIKELSGGGEAGAGFFGLAPLCVNLGATDGILCDYGFNISEENPAVVTFANGYTKTLKTLASVPDEPVDTNTTIYFGIDENGNIKAFKSIKYADNEPANISSSQLPCLWINTASPIRQTKAKYEEQTEWENKNIVPFADYKKSNQAAEINNYEYNSNGFNDDFSKSITGKSQNCELELIYTNTIELNLSNKFYDLGKTSYDQTYFLKKDVNFPKSGMGIFYLSIYTEQEVIIDIKALDYSKVKLSGGKIGSLGSGRYLATLYYNFSNDDTFMMVNYFSEPEADLPPEVE
ncbi:TPA: hypothetical protein IAA68_05560 [Candidatus Galligastranaerophilus faecipullorum]|nr:hypothetical protein [Candidatus Galligastranaerophilus faecipullorum]